MINLLNDIFVNIIIYNYLKLT